jgi:hypothetical protein
LALLEDLADGVTPGGVMTGLGAALLLTVVAPAGRNLLRPAARTVMRTGITLYRSTVEPLVASVGDLVTEAQLELAAGKPTAKPDTKPKSSHGRKR